MEKRIRELKVDGSAMDDIKKRLVTPKRAKKLAKKNKSKKKGDETPYRFDDETLDASELEEGELEEDVKKIVKKTEDEKRLSEIYR
jgi:hypothetical protein